MKKVAIVYYSMTENTDYVAKHISENIEADLIRIVPQKEYPNSGFKKFLWGGKSAIMGETPKLEPYEFGETKYDYIIFGTPVWASSFVPPIRTFIKDNRDKLNGKKFAVFVCYSGGGAEKTIEKLKNYLEIDNFIAELILIDPKDKQSDDNTSKIIEFCRQIENNNH